MIPSSLAARAVLLAWVLGGGAGCGPGAASPGTCAPKAPAACPTPPPQYAAEVDPVIARRCRPCHTAGGAEATAPLDTYEQVHARRAEILSRVNACLMPPADQPQPSEVERAALLAWLVCGAQND